MRANRGLDVEWDSREEQERDKSSVYAVWYSKVSITISVSFRGGLLSLKDSKVL